MLLLLLVHCFFLINGFYLACCCFCYYCKLWWDLLYSCCLLYCLHLFVCLLFCCCFTFFSFCLQIILHFVSLSFGLICIFISICITIIIKLSSCYLFIFCNNYFTEIPLNKTHTIPWRTAHKIVIKMLLILYFSITSLSTAKWTDKNRPTANKKAHLYNLFFFISVLFGFLTFSHEN